MICCAVHGKGHLTFCENTCNVEGREEQHDPMIMQWRFTSEAAKSVDPLPAQTSSTSASGAQEHASKEADPKPLPYDKISASEHDSESEPDWNQSEPASFTDEEKKREADEDPLSQDSKDLNVPERSVESLHDSESEPDGNTDEKRKREADEDRMSEESKDEIRSIGFALAQSLALLPEFALPKKSKNCIDSAAVDVMRNVCSEEDIQALTYCMESFFLKRLVLQSTASTTDDVPAQTLKSAEEIRAVWTEILTRRRLEEEDDTAPINDSTRLKEMHANWLQDFIDNELTAEQLLKARSKQTSMFAAYLRNNFGGKAFVMALWQTGISWAPTTHMKETNYDGALEHIALNFAQWAQRIIRARTLHQENADYKEARRRSGDNTGKHGLTEEETRNREARKTARIDYYWTQALNNQVLASKGKRTRKGKGKEKGKSLPPKAYHEMSPSEQWWLRQLWSGRLRADLEQAEKLCSRVQAKDFNVFDYE